MLQEDRDLCLFTDLTGTQGWARVLGWCPVCLCVFGRVRQEIMVATVCDGPSKWFSQELKRHILSLLFFYSLFLIVTYPDCFNPYYTLAHYT